MIDRLSVFDCAELVADVGPNPRSIGVLLELDGPAPRREDVMAHVAARIAAVPRLRQRIVPTPWGAGRPVLVDVVPDLLDHVTAATATPETVLDVATALLLEPFAMDRPLWRLAIVDLGGDRSALVWSSHHALADGPGLLSGVLRLLGGELESATDAAAAPGTAAGAAEQTAADTAAGTAADAAAGPAEGPGAGSGAGAPVLAGRWPLMRDAWGERCRSLIDPSRARRLVLGVAELTSSTMRRTCRTPLVQPISHGFVLRTTSVNLPALKAGARSVGATVNDALLTAWAAALSQVSAAVGAPIPEVTVSCTVSMPSGEVDNRVGVFLVPVATPRLPGAAGTRASVSSSGVHREGDSAGALEPPGRVDSDAVMAALAAVATDTRRRKSRVSGSSWKLMAQLTRGVAALGLYRRFVERQRSITTLVTNLRGPQQPMRVLGRDVVRATPVATMVGNITTVLAALSHADELVVTVMCSPESAEHADALVGVVAEQLVAMAVSGHR